MDQAVAQALRAGAVVRLLREFTSRGDTERFALRTSTAVVEEICELATLGTATDAFDLELNLAANPPPVLIDHIQIQQVILNLVRNSIDALSGRESPTITVATQCPGATWSRSPSATTGPGCPQEIRERVFEPFVSTKPDGIGIGLSICRTIVEAHGGRIVVDTGAKRGTEFRFSVPVFDESSGLQMAGEADSRGRRRQRPCARRSGRSSRPRAIVTILFESGIALLDSPERSPRRMRPCSTSRCRGLGRTGSAAAPERSRPDAAGGHRHRPRGHRDGGAGDARRSGRFPREAGEPRPAAGECRAGHRHRPKCPAARTGSGPTSVPGSARCTPRERQVLEQLVMGQDQQGRRA